MSALRHTGGFVKTRCVLRVLLLCAALLPCIAGAESFQLADGTELEADVVRRTRTSVTLKYENGIGTYRAEDFSPETRDRLFAQLDQLAAKDRELARQRILERKGPATWATMTGFERAQTLCAIAGGITVILADLWFIVAAFSVSALWGMLILFFGGLRSVGSAVLGLLFFAVFANSLEFVPPVTFTVGLIGIALLMSSVGLVFIIRHWRQAMGPLILNLIGIALVVIAACLEVIWTAV